METANKLLLMTAVAFLFYGQSVARAEVSSYVDKNGTRYYINAPPDTSASTCRLYQRDKVVTSKPTNTEKKKVPKQNPPPVKAMSPLQNPPPVKAMSPLDL